MAQKIEQKRHTTGGLEGTLDFAATALLVIGVIGAILCLVWFRFLGILPAFSIIVNTVLIWLLLRAIAEIIRLLKKQAGMTYGGRISETATTIVYTCGDCGAMLHSDTRCDACGVSIETN